MLVPRSSRIFFSEPKKKMPTKDVNSNSKKMQEKAAALGVALPIIDAWVCSLLL